MSSIDLLRNLPIFQELSDEDFEKLAKITTEENYKEGDVLFREGDRPEAFYVVRAGEVHILKKADGGENLIARLVNGDFFGEMGVIEDTPRYASAIVKSSSQLLKIKRADFDTMMALNPGLAMKIMVTVTRRYRANVSLEQTYGSSQTPPEEEHHGKVFAVTSMTGGSGKSTVASNLASYLTHQVGTRVILIDSSIQFGDLSLFMDVIPRLTLFQLTEETEITIELLQDGYIHKTDANVDLIAAPLKPEQSDVVTPDLFRRLITLLKRHYDYIVLDTYSQMQEPLLTILELSDHVIYLVTPDLPSVKNSRLWYEVIEALELTEGDVHFVVNKYDDEDPTLDVETIQENINHELTAVIPYAHGVVTDCINKGILIAETFPDEDMSQAVAHLCLTITHPEELSEEEAEEVEKGWLGNLKKRFGLVSS